MSYYAPAFMLLVLVALAVYLLYRWQNNHSAFDLADLLTGDNGRVSFSKFALCCSLAVSTWGFVVLVQQDKLSEFYYLAYMVVWAGYKPVQTIADKKAP